MEEEVSSTSLPCKSYDIGLLLESKIDIRNISRDDLYNILTKEPDLNLSSYPRTRLCSTSSTSRQFQPSWLLKHPWIHYSCHTDGVFCRACAMFAPEQVKVRSIGCFVSKPYRQWNNVGEKMNVHATQDYHLVSMAKMSEFISRYKNPSQAIQNILDSEAQKAIQNNRQVIVSLLKIVMLCGKQGFALRGHRDDKICWMEQGEDKHSAEGNFVELVRFRAETDQVLSKHLENAPRNAKYTSKTIQNQLIEVIGKNIQKVILDEVKEAKYYTVIADEVTDVSNKEQLSLCLRYVFESAVKEVFVDFIEVERITGETLAQSILQWLTSNGLSLANIRGQCYDGASNMSGAKSGCKAIVQEKAPLAVYFHCAAHRLNLAVVSACKVQQFKNAESYVGEVARFFGYSAKRQRLLDRILDLKNPRETKAKKLKDACRTRWVQRIDAYIVFVDMLPAIHTALEAMVYPHQHEEVGTNWKWDSETMTKANGFLFQIESSTFLLCIMILKQVLFLLRELTVKLQMEANDVAYAYRQVHSLVSTLTTIREKSETEFKKIFQETTRVGQQLYGEEFQLEKPRIARRQMNRNNHNVSGTEDYFRVTLYNEFISHVIAELQERFVHNPAHDVTLSLLFLLPSECIREEDDAELPVKLAETVKVYNDDLPYPQMFPTEYTMWIRKWKVESNGNSSKVPNKLADVFQSCSSLQFPNIHALLQLALTLPITSCESERSFSQLKLIKTDRRSTMSENRLSGLALMKVHQNLCNKLAFDDKKMEELVKSFEQLHPRKMKLSFILAD